MRNVFIFLLIIAGVFILVTKKEVWSGYFYPNADNLSTWIESEETFDNIEACRSWARQEREMYVLTNPELAVETESDYECGLNCKYRDGFNVCKETIH